MRNVQPHLLRGVNRVATINQSCDPAKWCRDVAGCPDRQAKFSLFLTPTSLNVVAVSLDQISQVKLCFSAN